MYIYIDLVEVRTGVDYDRTIRVIDRGHFCPRPKYFNNSTKIKAIITKLSDNY